jgi:hypothetical protein
MQDLIAKAKATLVRMTEKIRSMRRSASEEGMELVHEVETEEVFMEETLKETIKSRYASIRMSFMEMTSKLSRTEHFMLIFVFGIIIGFGMKTAANGHLTIGYRDYTTGSTNTYDFIELQKKVAATGSGSAFSGGVSAGGSTCSQ